jgi:hypothetical protein
MLYPVAAILMWRGILWRQKPGKVIFKKVSFNGAGDQSQPAILLILRRAHRLLNFLWPSI